MSAAPLGWAWLERMQRALHGSWPLHEGWLLRRGWRSGRRRPRQPHALLVEHATSLVEHLCPAGRRLYVSPASGPLYQRRPERLVGGVFGTHAAPGYEAPLAAALASWRQGAPCPVVYEAMRADRSLLWVESDGKPALEGDGLIVVTRDVSRRKQTERELAEATARLDTALNNMTQGLVMYDAGERLIVFNARYREMYGLEPHQLRTGMSFREVLAACIGQGRFPGRAVDDVYGERMAFLRRQRSATFVDRPDDGRVVAVTVEMMPDGGWVSTLEDVTERHRAQERVAFMAHHDGLTGLANRVLLGERFELALGLSRRSGGQIAVLCLDLDRFKAVNDTLGHAAGDLLLRQVADRLRGITRANDTVARVGGDEFVILQTEVRQPEAAGTLAARIAAVLAPPFDLDGMPASIGASIGIALHPQDGAGTDGLLRSADTALYRTKAAGRGTYRFYEPAMDRQVHERQHLERELREAVGTDALTLHYQPVFTCSGDGGQGGEPDYGRRCTGFEALMRWRHPVRGWVPPPRFIPVAEESGLIVPLGAWALEAACTEAAQWPGGLTLSVNLSPAQFRAGDLVDQVAQVLRRTGLAASRLELDVTEALLLADADGAARMLDGLRALGAGVAFDDFGTGSSSLGHLQRYPFSRLKIDRSFVAALGSGTGAGWAAGPEAIVAAVLAMAGSLGIDVTAEGVETEAQLAVLERMGCGFVQGFLSGAPMCAAEVPAFLGDGPVTTEAGEARHRGRRAVLAGRGG